MKLSVCIDAVLGGVDTIEAMRTVKASGIDAIEFWGWRGKPLDAIRAAMDELHMEVAAFCAADSMITDPARHAQTLEGLAESIEAAQKVGCKTLIFLAGDDRVGVAREEQHAAVVAGLRACAPMLAEHDITLALEPLNILVDHKGYYLTESAEAYQILEEVASSNVKMLFDIYHQQITEGNLIQNATRMVDRIVHFHCAGNPGRHELDNGEINYDNIFRALHAAGYNGYVGLEYFPVADPAEGLKRVAARFNQATGGQCCCNCQ